MAITDDVSEELCQRFLNEADSVTLEANISFVDAARIYREIAAEFNDRARMLDEEAAAAGFGENA